VRFDGEHLQTGVSEVRGDLDRGGFAEVIDVRLEGEAEAGDDGILARGGADLRDDVVRLGVIDLAGGAEKAGLRRRGVDDEPRVDRDAVSADAGAGLKDLHAWGGDWPGG
jgi:hypothetical protein